MKIIAINSYPKSGSTIFGMSLGQYENSIFVGEVSAIFYSGWRRDCTCQDNPPVEISNCPVWKPVLENLSPIAAKYDYLNQGGIIPTAKKFLLKKALKQLKSYEKGKELLFLKEGMESVYNTISEASGCQIIIDTSKDLEYIQLRNNFFKDRVYNIHMTRHPLGILNSSRKKPSAANVDKGINIFRAAKVAGGWGLKVNWIDDILKKSNNPRQKIKYEDWCNSPKQISDNTMRWVNNQIVDNPFLSENEFIVNNSHVLRGNRSSRKKGIIRVKKDATWNKNLELKYKIIGQIFSLYTAKKNGYKFKTRANE